MVKYIHGESYRLLHKKSMYIYFGALAVGYLLITYIRAGGYTAESIVDEAINLFNFLPVLVGGFLFAAIYTDDLNSRNLTSLVGFGLSKTKIVISKIILITLFSVVVFGLTPVFHCVVFFIFGWPAIVSTWTMLYALTIKFMVMTIAFSALSGIVVYGLQKTTFAIVSYILLAFGIVSGLISSGLNTFAPSLTRYLMSGISDRVMTDMINGGSLVIPMIEYTAYVLIVTSLSVLAFYRKEMEF